MRRFVNHIDNTMILMAKMGSIHWLIVPTSEEIIELDAGPKPVVLDFRSNKRRAVIVVGIPSPR